MSVGLVCPQCAAATNYHQPPVDRCPSCGAPFPEQLRRSAEASLARQHATRPGLLTVGMYLSAAGGALILVALLAASCDAGNFSLNDEPVTGPEFLRTVGLQGGTLGLLLLLIAYGLWQERSWARPLMMVFWFACTVFLLFSQLRAGTTASAIGTTLFWGAVYAGPSAAYLYFKESVTAYYRALEQAEDAGLRTRGHDA